MKKLLLLLALPFIINTQAVKADEVSETTKNTLEEALTSELNSVILPKAGKKKFYTYCSSFQLAFVLGYETGLCLSLSVDSKGNVDYIPVRLRNWKVSWGAGLGLNEGNLHRVKGVSSLSDINGYYLIASSGAGFVGSVRENWFTLKLSLKDLVGNTPEMDGGVPVLNVGLDIISLGLMQYKSVPGAKVQRTKI
jgi:hypothetical protein